MIARELNRAMLEEAQRLQADKRWSEAEPLWRAHLEIDPTDACVWFNLGAAMQAQATNPATRTAAAECYRRILSIPDAPIETKGNAMNNIGILMQKVGRPDKAQICYHLAIQIDPNNAAARVNFGDALRYEGKYEEADQEFAAVLRLDPESAGAKFSSGMIKLLLGDLKTGFELYENRFEVSAFPAKRFQSDKPRWMGEDLSGKTILVTEEQGYGDTFQLIRYAPMLKALGATVVFRGGEALADIISEADGVDCCCIDAGTIEYDYHVPTMSLPHRFGTTLETIPSRAPYIRPRGAFELPEHDFTDGPRIGLVWAGSPLHGRDEWRSVAPEALQPIVDANPHCTFYALQCGPRAHEAARLRNVIDLAPSLKNWTDTALALKQLDTLISVDTACVHLAGALGVRTLMLCPHSPDFRWLLGTDRSPWYPQMRLFRQTVSGEWETPIAQIISQL